MIGLSIIVLLILLPIWAATLVWLYRDATRLGKPGILVTLLIGFILWPMGLLVWLILRGDWEKAAAVTAVGNAIPPRACPRCGRELSRDTAHGLCPACLLQQAAFSESGAPNPSAFTPPSVAELAPLFPQLEILELLGRGGMGAVYKARQPGLDRLVALKILPVTPGGDPSFNERFQREARALATLSHPNIVGVFDFGQTPTLSYFIMEYVDGVNLRQLEHTSKLTPREALAIVPQVCEALQFAHDRGIVHRDIKPENILVDKQGRVKIADFGLAKLMRVEPSGFALTQSHHVVGTPQYMAPEQVEHPQDVDHRADIYSLGVVFYEMLTGELPMGRFASPSQKVEIDVRLDEVVLKALEKEPGLRYQQASVFKTKIENVGSAPGQLATDNARREKGGIKRSVKGFWGCCILVAMGMVFELGVAVTSDDKIRTELQKGVVLLLFFGGVFFIAGAIAYLIERRNKAIPVAAVPAHSSERNGSAKKGDRMTTHQCPHCGKLGITALRRAFLGPAIPATCMQCGQKMGVPGWSVFMTLPMLLCLWAALSLDVRAITAVWLAVVGVAVSALLWETCVPLIKR